MSRAGKAAASSAALDVEEYNRAVDQLASTVAQLGVGAAEAEDEDGFPLICKLNVGGQEFQCHRDHLRSQPGSKLTAVFMGEEECEYDDQGRFYFDHDPSHFNLILNFMRTSECVIPYERGAFESFRKDVQFWRLDTLEARADIHFKKYIQPLLSGEKGLGSAAKRKGPNGMAVHAKFAAKQKEMNGAMAEKVCEAVHNALIEGAAAGYNRITLTSYRPPETIGVATLPLWKQPEWSTLATLYCWDPAFVGFFQPASGYPMLYAVRDFLVEKLESYGFKVTPSFDAASGISYDIMATTGDE